MPLAVSENGAAVFLKEGSDEWNAHVAKHGPMLAHSTVSGQKGRWIRALEFTPPPYAEKYAPAPNQLRDPQPPDEAAKARVTAVQKTFLALHAKNQAAFEPTPLVDDSPPPQGATSEERDRNAASARLQQLKAETLPPISQAALQAAGIQPKRGDDKAWTTDDKTVST